MIVRSSPQPLRVEAVRKYGGTVQALSTIFAEEGVQGWLELQLPNDPAWPNTA